MNWKRYAAAAAIVVAGTAAGAVVVSSAVGSNDTPAIESHLPDEYRLEHLPNRVGVAGSDGQTTGYVDKNLLLARTRDLPLPGGIDENGPFPVYDGDGKEIGTWSHDHGFTDLDGNVDRVAPTTTAAG